MCGISSSFRYRLFADSTLIFKARSVDSSLISSFSTPGSSVTTTTSFPLSITSTSGSRSSFTSGPRAPGSTFPNSRITGFPSGPTDMEKPYTNGEAPSDAFGISTALRSEQAVTNTAIPPRSQRTLHRTSATTDLARSSKLDFPSSLRNPSSNPSAPSHSPRFSKTRPRRSGLTSPQATRTFADRSIPRLDGVLSNNLAWKVRSSLSDSIVLRTSGLSEAVPRRRTAKIGLLFKEDSILVHPVPLRHYILSLRQRVKHRQRRRRQRRG